MISAAVEAVAEHGYAGLTVAQVIGRARVSRKTFYDVFADRDDCFLAAFESCMQRARAASAEAYRAEVTWQAGVRGGLGVVLAMMDEEPAAARLCVVEALGAGERVLAARAAVFEDLAVVIDHGRSAGGADPPALTAEGVVGAISSVLHSRLVERPGRPVLGLLGSLMSIVVFPYLGAQAAARELDRPAAKPRRRVSAPRCARREDPLDGLEMRLTYRTVRVLMAIAAHPGASNREIAAGSGIADQGQISKLLGRLARLELVVNRGEGPERGAPNAWYLTARGKAVEHASRPR